MKNHIDAGNFQRFYEEIDSFVVDDEGLDYECASARLLGRDIGEIGTGRAIRAILDVLDRETGPGGQYTLISDIQVGTTHSDDFDTILRLLEHLKAGICDVERSKN